MKEQQIQSKKIKDLEAQGYYVIKLIEVKKPDGKMSKLQEFRKKELENHGVKVEIFKGNQIKLNGKQTRNGPPAEDSE